MEYFIATVVLLVVLMAIFRGFRRVTIFEYEKGLKYFRGRFTQVLEPGLYWYLPYYVLIHKIDVRPRFETLQGQEVLSSDAVTLKVSLAANYEITDPKVAVNEVQRYDQALYLELQLALRVIIGESDIDSILSSREEFSKKLLEAVQPKAAALGLRLISVNVRDIMFPGALKEVFAQVVTARKEGEAALERARGESAALRNLANAAKLIDTNPNLLQLRLIQALQESSGNTLILGMPASAAPVPVVREAKPS